jgi:hypothetical protein
MKSAEKLREKCVLCDAGRGEKEWDELAGWFVRVTPLFKKHFVFFCPLPV